jgi:hypothetical protein
MAQRTIRFTDEEIAKLPKWAQSKVSAMNADLDSANKELDSLIPAGDKESPVVLWLGFDQKIPLPQDTILFRLGKHEEIAVNLQKSDGIFKVSSNGGRLVVKPSSSNVIECSVEKF